MQKIKLVIFCLCMFFISCNKAVSIENTDNENTAIPNGFLEKMVTISGNDNTDTVTSEFFYDASGKLEEEKIIQKVFYDGTLHSSFGYNHFYRDPQGRITYITINAANPDIGGSYLSKPRSFWYEDATSEKVIYQLLGIGPDSASFIYNSAGKIDRIEYYDASTGGRVLNSHDELGYDAAGNVSRVDMFGYSDEFGHHPEAPLFTYSFEYDSHENPLDTDDYIILKWAWTWKNSRNNELNCKVSQHNMTGLEYEIKTEYQYRGDGKPDISIKSVHDFNGVKTSATAYYYKE